MATVELTTANFDEITGADGIVLVDFWAEWCGPCLRFAPIYERVSENHEDITFGKVDTEAQQDLAMRYRIQSIPTIMAIRDGVIVFAQPGMLPEAAVEELVRQVKALDMEEVKAAEAKAREEHEKAHAEKAKAAEAKAAEADAAPAQAKPADAEVDAAS